MTAMERWNRRERMLNARSSEEGKCKVDSESIWHIECISSGRKQMRVQVSSHVRSHHLSHMHTIQTHCASRTHDRHLEENRNKRKLSSTMQLCFTFYTFSISTFENVLGQPSRSLLWHAVSLCTSYNRYN